MLFLDRLGEILGLLLELGVFSRDIDTDIEGDESSFPFLVFLDFLGGFCFFFPLRSLELDLLRDKDVVELGIGERPDAAKERRFFLLGLVLPLAALRRGGGRRRFFFRVSCDSRQNIPQLVLDAWK